jgi:hypothetical protein
MNEPRRMDLLRRRLPGGALRRFAAIGLALAALVALAGARAQTAPAAVVAPGEAAVAGFSGAPPPARIAPGEDPAAKTFIDLGGPSLRVVDLRRMDGPAAAQAVRALKPFTFTARDLGQVFGVALDDADPPNLYVAATSAYGLPIVVPGPGGAAVHVRRGAPGATFMPGLWGPRGGPGTIFKIDGVAATVTPFAEVKTDGRANSGAALGALAYDPRTKSLYVSDRESGLIHRFSPGGVDLGVYDHGVVGLAAQGLPPAPWTRREPIDLASPAFDSGDPSTWNLAAPERRAFGLAVRDGRLYYAVADSLRVWSVGLKDDGGFGDDATIELAAPPAAGPTEIATIAFDDQGRMLLAERAAATGAFGFEPLAQPAIGRLLRYAMVGRTADGRRIWRETPDEYAIGFPGDYRNVDGGVAEGYAYARSGELLPGSCGGFLWTTGEDLRDAADRALAARLAQTGPLPVDGLQGEGVWQDRPLNLPPLMSYFVAYGDGPWEEALHGRMGAIAIRRDCAPAAPASPARSPAAPSPAPPPTIGGPTSPPSPPPATPPAACNPNELRGVGDGAAACQPSCQRPDVQVGDKCCPPSALAANAACSNSSCPAGQTPIGPSNFCCESAHVYASASGAPACCAGAVVDGQCAPPPPACAPSANGQNCPPSCAAGYVAVGGACCLAGQLTSTGVCCPAGEAPSGANKSACGPILRIPTGPSCCASGLIPTASGVCCAPANVTTAGACCPRPVDPANRSVCPPAPLVPATPVVPACAPGYSMTADGSCCSDRRLSADRRSCLASAPPCAPGQVRDQAGRCAAVASPPSCPRGQERVGTACAAACPPGEARSASGLCKPIATPCRRGEARNRDGVCAPIAPAACPPSQLRDRRGVCVRSAIGPCPPGFVRNGFGACVPFAPPGLFAPPGQFAPPGGPNVPAPGAGRVAPRGLAR